jgi:hypothetical protein
VREVTASRTPESTTKPDGPESGRVLYCARPAMICVTCQKDEQEVTLYKCPICFKPICTECARREYGRTFCSKLCADQFFFGDDDE